MSLSAVQHTPPNAFHAMTQLQWELPHCMQLKVLEVYCQAKWKPARQTLREIFYHVNAKISALVISYLQPNDMPIITPAAEYLKWVVTMTDTYAQIYFRKTNLPNELVRITCDYCYPPRFMENLLLYKINRYYVSSTACCATMFAELPSPIPLESCWRSKKFIVDLPIASLENSIPSKPLSLRFTSLDINRNALTPALVQKVVQFTNLTALIMPEAKLATALLAEILTSLRCLRRLDIENNDVQELPESLYSLENLEDLNISHNDLARFPRPTSAGNLKILNLNFNLLHVPEWINSCDKLETLMFSSNELDSIPESLGCLTSLRVLDISGNFLETLPDALEELMNLQELDISGNCIEVIPRCVFRLISLRRLMTCGVEEEGDYNDQLCNNQPPLQFADSLAQLINLEYLDISMNHLRALPEGIEALVHLRTLNIYRNFITNFDPLKNLKNVTLIY